MAATDTPRIYVASLSDYNAGRLHGCWIDLDETTDADDIQEQVDAMLAKSPEPLAEEWAIHDYEGFGPIRLTEYERFETVATLANKIAEHGDAFAAWVNGDSWRKDHPGAFEDAYCGEFKSREDYAYEWAESSGILKQLEDIGMDGHVDWESYANDLLQDYETTETPDGGIYVFDLR